MTVRSVVVAQKPHAPDERASRLRERLSRELQIETGSIWTARVYTADTSASPSEVADTAKAVLSDAILEDVFVDGVPIRGGSWILVGRLPGVTDDLGKIAARELATHDAAHFSGVEVFSQTLYHFQREFPSNTLVRIGKDVLANELVDSIAVSTGEPPPFALPAVRLPEAPKIEHVSLRVDDARLRAISDERGLALNLEELHAIVQYTQDSAFVASRTRAGLTQDLTDCELEIIAQTWSEHCKHKEFNATVTFEHDGSTLEINSLFQTFIRSTTETIRAKYRERNEDWMVTVFSDNAGVVRLDRDRLFVLKVETHNSPSALDPVGGAMTGVLGNNRDAFGTGKGGARLLFNTNVLCFAPPTYDKPLLAGQKHPSRIIAGVRDGVEQGGNKCGVPTINGAIVFDDRYAGKPLVYCGTGAILPALYGNTPSHEKIIHPGDRIVLVGGRTGRDGIHGATYSSILLTEDAPKSIVQIGSPFTQKLVSDFLEEACAKNLVGAATDDGAGGLSSSVGELATLCGERGGAKLDVSKVPLKYDGLAPWEIVVSESQERMTLAVSPANMKEIFELAAARGVEISDIGEFTDSGEFEVVSESKVVALLDLGFLHGGVPKKTLQARWQTPSYCDPVLPNVEHGKTLHSLLSSPNIATRERIVRQYDHEVKGLTVLKAYMGEQGHTPQDAGVIRLEHEGFAGLAVSNGICPKLSDLDPYQSSACAFDEAVRSLVSVGVRLPMPGSPVAWSACDNFCVPDSAYDPLRNPDGREKLGALVRMCQALRDLSLLFDVPMTSGKDSMKNDFVAGDQKISVPPTVLFTVVAKMEDVRRIVTSDFKKVGDVVFVIGSPHEELGASEFYRLYNATGGMPPTFRSEIAKSRYLKMMKAHERSLLESSHDISDGGLVVALAECLIGTGLGAEIKIPSDLTSTNAWLYCESPSRFVVSVRPERAGDVTELFGDDAFRLGQVISDGDLFVEREQTLFVESVDDFANSYQRGPL